MRHDQRGKVLGGLVEPVIELRKAFFRDLGIQRRLEHRLRLTGAYGPSRRNS